jgi:hypothetical protein
MYFAAMPQIFYDGTGKQQNWKVVTNLLRRVKVRQLSKAHASVFDTYDIKEGETPEMIAHKLYGDAELHWIILLTNEITDRYHGWPLSTPQFIAFVKEKYDDPDGAHHYEISQVSGDTSVVLNVGTTNADYPTATLITNFEYEEKLQDSIRNIKLIDPSYVEQFVSEYKTLMAESTY